MKQSKIDVGDRLLILAVNLACCRIGRDNRVKTLRSSLPATVAIACLIVVVTSADKGK